MLKFISTLSAAVLCLSTVTYSMETKPSTSMVKKEPSRLKGLMSEAESLNDVKELALNRFRGQCKVQVELHEMTMSDVRKYIQEARKMYKDAIESGEAEGNKFVLFLDKQRIDFREAVYALTTNKDAINDFKVKLANFLTTAKEKSAQEYADSLLFVNGVMDVMKPKLGDMFCEIQNIVNGVTEDLK